MDAFVSEQKMKPVQSKVSTPLERREGTAREHVLNFSELLFSERGFLAVTMRDIAAAAGMRQASLYYHAPEGKEQLFVEVTEQNLRRWHDGIQTALAIPSEKIPVRLHALASWLTSQPPLNLLRLYRSDIPALTSKAAEQVLAAAYSSVLEPVERLFLTGRESNEIRPVDTKLLAVTFLSAMDALHEMSRYTDAPITALAHETTTLFLDGIRRR